MPFIYMMSDIHGEIEAFKDKLELIDFDNANTQLILLGDYIDHKYERHEIYPFIMNLQRKHPKQVIAIRGNIDESYVEYCSRTLDITSPDVIKWIKGLPLYVSNEKQIFVHAGIDEEAGDLWRIGTPDYEFTSKYPPEKGRFYKDIIAGHVGTHSEFLSDDPNFHDVFWDGESHYYLDGTSELTHQIPLLKYDTDTGKYTTFKKDAKGNWKEIPVTDEAMRKRWNN